jgi:hypothetical protein
MLTAAYILLVLLPKQLIKFWHGIVPVYAFFVVMIGGCNNPIQ